MSNPETSIIVRTFNEERYLPGLLAGIGRQRYTDYEIVNVDSGSFDRTIEIITQHGARIQRIKSSDFTFGYSLNVGIEAARGRFMVIVSAHTKPVDDFWLENLITPLREERTAMVYGRQYAVASSKFGEARDLTRTYGPEGKRLKPPHYFANNANSALRKDLWSQHAFDGDLTGQEDIEWAKYYMRLGYDVVYEPDAGVYHIHHETWRQVRNRYYRESLATRNIGVWRRMYALPFTAKEVKYLAQDLVHAARSGELASKAVEIARFRYNKSYGMVRGLIDSEGLAAYSKREALFFDRKCKSLVIHGKGHASITEIDVPTTKPGDVLIRVAYAGVTGADVGMVTGDKSFYGGREPNYPVIPGRELSGWVAGIGARVTHVEEGDPVAVSSAYIAEADGQGAHSQYVSVPGEFVHKLPKDIDMRRAVACDAVATVSKALKKVDSVLRTAASPPKFAVIGAGPVGYLTAQMLAMREYSVTVFDRNPKRLSLFEGTSVATRDDREHLDEFNVLVEATGDPEALNQMVERSRPGATLLLLGLPYSHRQFNIQGGSVFDKTMIWPAAADSSDFQDAIEALPKLAIDRFTDCVVPLDRFEDAWEQYRNGSNLKVLLQLS